jgi:hypothetical protein
VDKIRYTGSKVAVCTAARSLPNPPTGSGASVSGWTQSAGDQLATDEFELTILAGASVSLAAGAMLVSEETFDTYPEVAIAVTAEADDEKFTLASHGFETGDGPVRISAAALPTGVSATTEYYVIRIDANTFYLATSRANALAGTNITYTTDGTTVVLNYVTGTKSLSGTFTAANATEIFTKTGHGLSLAQAVQVRNSGGALPTGLSANTDYYVIPIDADTFYLATSSANALAGTHLSITTDGTGTNTIVYHASATAYPAPTSATAYCVFAVLNGGDAIALTGSIGYTERVQHRPGVSKYHLVATLDQFVPVTAYVQGLAYIDC